MIMLGFYQNYINCLKVFIELFDLGYSHSAKKHLYEHTDSRVRTFSYRMSVWRANTHYGHIADANPYGAANAKARRAR